MSEAGPSCFMDPYSIAHYERFIFRHTMRVADKVEMDFEDIQQTYRIKVWKALESFDEVRYGRPLHRDGATSCRCSRCRFVFTCLKNMEKDLLKRKRHYDAYIEDVAPAGTSDSGLQSRDRWEARYLAAGEEVFAEVEEEELPLPSTLSAQERRIVVLLCGDYSQAEIRRDMGLERSVMDRAVKSIRVKMADWRPDSVRQPALLAVA